MALTDDSSIVSSLNLQECRCNTCKALFSSIEKVKDHYRSDWHIFNSKRRANQLLPLSKDDYKRAIPLIQKKAAAKKVFIQNGQISHIQPVPQNDNNINKNAVKSINVINIKDNEKEIIESADNTETIDEDENENDDDIDNMNEDVVVEPTHSAFDNKTFDTVDECVEYMAIKYGFFIPDIEYLVDLNGFITYVNMKIKCGKTCLYCQKRFRSYYSCQAHMISKSHCKILYENGVDGEEFDDFYDFSSSYEDADEDEEDEVGLEISPIGELVLPNGKTVGHRAFKLYYKQRFHPEENRISVISNQREELLRLGLLQGGSKLTYNELMELNEVQVMTMLIRKQKEIRKQEVIVERMKQKRDFIDQRREYKSTVDKLRSSATTTAKIRDYHSMLM